MFWKSWERTADKGPSAIAWRAGCFVLCALLVVSAVGSCLHFVANPFVQGQRIIDKTIDADNVLYNYEWFKRQWRDVQAIDNKIVFQHQAVKQLEDAAGGRSSWTREDREEHARLASIATGLEQQRADMVALYNARASMANRQIFMGGDCPDHIQ